MIRTEQPAFVTVPPLKYKATLCSQLLFMLTKSFGIILGSFLPPKSISIMSDLLSFTFKVYPALGHFLTSNLRQPGALCCSAHTWTNVSSSNKIQRNHVRLHSQRVSRRPVPAGSLRALFWEKEEIPKTHLISCCCLVAKL